MPSHSLTRPFAVAGARAAAVVATLALAAALAACGGGSGLGFDSAPAALDPNSPKIGAIDTTFDTSKIDVKAGAAFILVFENRENVGHNVSIYTDAGHTQRTFEGKVFSGPATRWYPVPALAAGTYYFQCDLHGNMTGTLVAT